MAQRSNNTNVLTLSCWPFLQFPIRHFTSQLRCFNLQSCNYLSLVRLASGSLSVSEMLLSTVFPSLGND